MSLIPTRMMAPLREAVERRLGVNDGACDDETDEEVEVECGQGVGMGMSQPQPQSSTCMSAAGGCIVIITITIITVIFVLIFPQVFDVQIEPTHILIFVVVTQKHKMHFWHRIVNRV